MIVACSKCAARLQLDAAKIPAHPFTVRCPKCGHVINAQPPCSNSAAPAGDADPASNPVLGDAAPLASERIETATPAAPFRVEGSQEGEAAGQKLDAGGDEVLRLLAALLQRGAGKGDGKGESILAGHDWETRRALVCVAPAHREAVARSLTADRYEVFVAVDTAGAIKRMREDRMNVLVLDPEFDRVEQGAAFINREIAQLRPADRRRLFVVQLSPTAHTADSHAAFVNHVNLIVNADDAGDLAPALERALRDFGDLYRDFNKALRSSSL